MVRSSRAAIPEAARRKLGLLVDKYARLTAMRVAVQKWGNSLAVRIPKAVAVESKLRQGSELELRLVNGSMLLRPIRRKRHLLAELLRGITKENVHPEMEWGGPVGREVW